MTEATLANLLRDAQARLAAVSDTPRLEAELLLAHALNKPRSHLHARPERVPDAAQRRTFAELLGQRLQHRPFAYLVGRREFWSLGLTVTPATLIPRPETERLVELALDLLPPVSRTPIADLGTGSGAIALALAKERPLARIVATDRSSAALAVARHNAHRLQIDNVEFRHGDWCQALEGEHFTLIAGNPPYLAAGDPHLEGSDLRFEPRTALVAGPDGLEAIRRIVDQAPGHLLPGGWLLLEHGCDQAEPVTRLLRRRGFTEVMDHRDAAGLPRVGAGRWPAG